MIKRRHGWPLGATTLRGSDASKRSSPDDVQRLLAEWNRQIRKETIAIRKRRAVKPASTVHPASLEEIQVVSRIGGLRLPKNLGGKK